jgi:hypothetical protein
MVNTLGGNPIDFLFLVPRPTHPPTLGDNLHLSLSLPLSQRVTPRVSPDG